MSMNYGLIGSALLAALVGKGVQGMSRAKRVNRYNDQLNSSLPQGYKMQGGDEGRFFFGDVNQQKTRLKGMYDQQLKQRAGDQYANRAGLQPGMDPEFAKTVYTSEYAPKAKAQALQQLKTDRGDQYGQWIQQNMPGLYANMGEQQPEPQPLPYAQAPQGLETDPSAMQPAFQGSVNTNNVTPLPQGMEVGEINGLLQRVNAGRTQQASQDRGDLAREKYENYEQPYRQMQMQKMQEQMKWIAPKAQAYIQRMHRSSGRAPTRTELAQRLLKDGDISQAEFKDFILRKPGAGQQMGSFLDSLLGSGGATPDPMQQDETGDLDLDMDTSGMSPEEEAAAYLGG